MLSAYAVVSLTASTSRKSSVSESGTLSLCHVSPPSAVRTTVPFAPLAQTTLSLTALTPRSLAVTPLDCVVQVGPCACVDSSAAASPSAAIVNVFTAGILPQSSGQVRVWHSPLTRDGCTGGRG